MELDCETVWSTCAIDTGNEFAAACRRVCDENPGKHNNPLLHIMVGTLTE